MRIDDDVMRVLGEAVTEGDLLRLVGQLDRDVYLRTNKALEAAGGKWCKKRKAHVFQTTASDALEALLLTGEVVRPQDFGYFPTPEHVVLRMAQMAEILPWMPNTHILEPSAGTGHIALVLKKLGYNADCIEILRKNCDELSRLNASEHIMERDFLQIEPDSRDAVLMGRQRYERIIMNPPFGNKADIHHVNHAMKFLAPNGILVSVMSAGIQFREDRLTATLRAMIHAHDGEIVPLEEGTFKESGTMVRACIVKIYA